MYIATVPNRNSPPAILLRESYREQGKVYTRTLANLTAWSAERIEAIKRVLKGDFDQMESGIPECAEVFGTLFALKKLADEVGVTAALGKTTAAKHALFLVLARIAHQGSRLSAVRFAQQHAVTDILGLEDFNEDDLYEALDWASDHQEAIEQRLYQTYVKRTGKPPELVLYDVTSSYFEGEQNELATYGYNRDGKRGKKQIVIGLVTSREGEPLAIRVFAGNTADPSTVATQIELLKAKFNVSELIFVGDRGMIKRKGKDALNAHELRYISALTDAQVRTLLKAKHLQMDLFEQTITEVEHEQKRYVLRRNDAVRFREAKRIDDKLERLQKRIDERNQKLQTSKRANAEKSLTRLQAWLKDHRLHTFVILSLNGRQITYHMDSQAKTQFMLLDGCYVMETDVPKAQLNTEAIDQCYRNLQAVERNFRTLKTGFLEVRPIFVRKKNRTQGHVLIAMLALKITRLFEKKLQQTVKLPTLQNRLSNLTLEDALAALSRFIFLRYRTHDKTKLRLPQPDALQSAIFEALGISLPTSLKCRQ